MRENSRGTGAQRLGAADRDIVALGIATAAILMFVGTGSTVLPAVVRSMAGAGLGPDKVLVNALLLNIALIIFGWRRYRELAGEVRERRRAEEEARLLAETDALTGCLNRRSLASSGAALVGEARTSGQAVALMMIDLDNFKQINDFHGHNTGDTVLRECAARIAASLPAGSLLARLGGDEFAALIAFEPHRAATIDDLAHGLIAAIQEPIHVERAGIEVTVSIGLTRSDSVEADADGCVNALLHMADIAMYHAKRNGRNCHFWFDAGMGHELRVRKDLEAGIRRGIPAGEFVPFYEQQIDLQTGELTGFEVLARWNSPRLGLVSPDVFIPVAEEIGLIGELSESVIAQALQDAKSWDPKLTLAVNISPLQLRDPWFAQKLLKLLVEAHFPPSRLEIEITESALHENVGAVRALIASLKNQGIRISLDDFGTGYSSLSQLRSLPFDRIKIDRSFVMGLADNPNSAAIVHAVAQLGRDLGLPITAEGVESREVLDQLLKYGDIKGQGYLYGQPQPADATRARLADMAMLQGGAAAEPGLVPPPAPALPQAELRAGQG